MSAAQAADRFLAEFDLGIAEHVVVDAGAAATFDAIRRADLSGDKVLGALGNARQWSEHVAAGRLGIELPATPRTLGDLLGPGFGWTALAEEPGTLLAFGLVGRPDPFSLHLEHLTAEAFASFAEPGFARAVAVFTLRPQGDGRTLLGLDLRARGTDDEMRSHLRGMGFLAKPAARMVARRALALVEHALEPSGR